MSEPASNTEQRIRDRAYALWQEAGRPEGRDHEFWHQAEAEENAAPTEGANATTGLGSMDVISNDLDESGEESFPASDPTDRT